MGKNKTILPDNTLIIWNEHPVSEYRQFFAEKTGEEKPKGNNFQVWLFSQAGKTLSEALEEYLHPSNPKTMEEMLSERRFNTLSTSEKAFIVAFDKAMNSLGYDFGGEVISGNVFSPMVIIYGKTGTKSRPCAARIYIKDSGIAFRLFFNKVDKHRQYIENAAPHIKEAFLGENGRCTFCWDNCPSRPAAYTVDGQTILKCHHHTFYFDAPSMSRLPDYMGLLREFYQARKNAKEGLLG